MNRILVDGGGGSKDLAQYIVPKGPVTLLGSNALPTDVVFRGSGPGNRTVEIGLEYKKLPDVLKCVGDGRFAGEQLEKLRQFDFAGLVVQGIWRQGSDQVGGQLEVWTSPMGRPRGWYSTADCGWGKRVWRWAELEHWLFTMQWKVGLWMPPVPPADCYATGRLVGSLYRWFNDKEWDQHKAHLAMDKSHLAPLRGNLGLLPRAISEVKGVGSEWTLAAERTFGNLYDATHASEQRWAGMTITNKKSGRKQRFGKGRAAVAVAEIRGKGPANGR